MRAAATDEGDRVEGSISRPRDEASGRWKHVQQAQDGPYHRGNVTRTGRVDRRRVAITGIGVVSPIGSGVADFWCGALAGTSAVRGITRFDATPFRSRIAAEVDDLRVEARIPPKRARRLDRYSLLGMAAGLQALGDAGLSEVPDVLRERAAVYLGSALGGVGFAESQHATFLGRGASAVDPALALAVFGAVAIGEAFRLLRSGAADLVLAGGAEAPLAPLTFGSFALIRALSERNQEPPLASRPFDRDRDGFVMAEGAAMLVLEEWDRAQSSFPVEHPAMS